MKGDKDGAKKLGKEKEERERGKKKRKKAESLESGTLGQALPSLN